MVWGHNICISVYKIFECKYCSSVTLHGFSSGVTFMKIDSYLHDWGTRCWHSPASTYGFTLPLLWLCLPMMLLQKQKPFFLFFSYCKVYPHERCLMHCLAPQSALACWVAICAYCEDVRSLRSCLIICLAYWGQQCKLQYNFLWWAFCISSLSGSEGTKYLLYFVSFLMRVHLLGGAFVGGSS